MFKFYRLQCYKIGLRRRLNLLFALGLLGACAAWVAVIACPVKRSQR